jgi:hypothetical protein
MPAQNRLRGERCCAGIRRRQAFERNRIVPGGITMSYRGITEQEFRRIIPIGEIQRHSGNCWACALSMVLRLRGFNVSEKYVTDLYHEWRVDGITADQVEQLVVFFNKNYLSKQGWIMKTTDSWQGHMSSLIEFAPIQIFIDAHFIVALGFDSDNGQTT